MTVTASQWCSEITGDAWKDVYWLENEECTEAGEGGRESRGREGRDGAPHARMQHIHKAAKQDPTIVLSSVPPGHATLSHRDVCMSACPAAHRGRGEAAAPPQVTTTDFGVGWANKEIPFEIPIKPVICNPTGDGGETSPRAVSGHYLLLHLTPSSAATPRAIDNAHHVLITSPHLPALFAVVSPISTACALTAG